MARVQAVSAALAEGCAPVATPLLEHCVTTFVAELTTPAEAPHADTPQPSGEEAAEKQSAEERAEAIAALLELLPLFSKYARALGDVQLAVAAHALAHAHIGAEHDDAAKVRLETPALVEHSDLGAPAPRAYVLTTKGRAYVL